MLGLYFRKPLDELILYGFINKNNNIKNIKNLDIRNYNIKIRGRIAVLSTTLDINLYNFLSKIFDLPPKKSLREREKCVMGTIEITDCKKLSYEEFKILQNKHYYMLDWWDKNTYGLLLKNPKIVIPPIPYTNYNIINHNKFVEITNELECDIVNRYLNI